MFSRCLLSHSFHCSLFPSSSSPLPYVPQSLALIARIAEVQKDLCIYSSEFSSILASIDRSSSLLSCSFSSSSLSRFLLLFSAAVRGLKTGFHSSLAYYSQLRDSVLLSGIGLDTPLSSECLSAAFWKNQKIENILVTWLYMAKEAKQFITQNITIKPNNPPEAEEDTYTDTYTEASGPVHYLTLLVDECESVGSAGVFIFRRQINDQVTLIAVENRGNKTIKLERMMIAEWQNDDPAAAAADSLAPNSTVMARFSTIERQLNAAPQCDSEDATRQFSGYYVRTEKLATSVAIKYRAEQSQQLQTDRTKQPSQTIEAIQRCATR